MSDSATPGDYRRALAHLRVQAALRAAETVARPPGLLAVFDADWPVSHTSNRVLVTADLPTLSGADEVIAFTDEAFQGRGLTHRKVDVLDDDVARRVSPALQALGFSHDEVLIMAARPTGPPTDDPTLTAARVVAEPVVRPLVERGWLVEAPDYPAETVRQLVGRRDAIDRAGRVTRLAVLDPETGAAVAKADLLVRDGVAEIDDVLTLPDHRGRGYASALVRAALSQAQGCDFVYLEAAADDWPQQLYAKLGFQTVGSIHEHTLLDVGAETGSA